jgi:phosphoglycerate dehydrogenase-like enzyme
VNTARGAVFDEKALINVLKAKVIARAALDIFAKEPLPPDNPILDLDNVVLTPHVGVPAAKDFGKNNNFALTQAGFYARAERKLRS